MTRRKATASLGLSVLGEIKAEKAAKPKSRKGKGGTSGDGRADADMVKRIRDNLFAFHSKDGNVVVDVATTYPMRGRKMKCRVGLEDREEFLKALAVVLADDDFIKAKADDFAERMKNK
jgi:hypothetical protein